MAHQSGFATRGTASFPLALASEGEEVQIVFIRSGRKREERLLSMGIMVEKVVTVMHSQPSGGKVILSGESRYALSSGMAQSITVVRV